VPTGGKRDVAAEQHHMLFEVRRGGRVRSNDISTIQLTIIKLESEENLSRTFGKSLRWPF